MVAASAGAGASTAAVCVVCGGDAGLLSRLVRASAAGRSAGTRSAASIVAFSLQRDWLYAAMTLAVLIILLVSFLLGKAE